jgi:hypothetical protein
MFANIQDFLRVSLPRIGNRIENLIQFGKLTFIPRSYSLDCDERRFALTALRHFIRHVQQETLLVRVHFREELAQL